MNDHVLSPDHLDPEKNRFGEYHALVFWKSGVEILRLLRVAPFFFGSRMTQPNDPPVILPPLVSEAAATGDLCVGVPRGFSAIKVIDGIEGVALGL